jgi:neutral trehalase
MYHSCSEDYNHAEILPSEKEKEDLYVNLKSAAESGWDFSSRWFISNGTNNGKIKVWHRLADMHRNWISQNQEKPSGLLHHLD